MKIKNLLLLGLMTLMSASVWAGTPTQFIKDGIQYKIQTIDPATFKATVTVEGIADNTKGKAIVAAKTVEIPATASVAVDDDTWALTVVGLENSWMNATGCLNFTGAETVTINIDNFTTKLPDPTTVLTSATKVTTFTLKGTSTIDADLTIPDYTATLSAMTTLDLSTLAPKAGKKLTLTAQTDNSKLATVKLPGVDVPASAFASFAALKTVTGTKNIGNSAFNGCAKLESIDLSEAETIGSSAFQNCAKLAAADLSKATTIGANAFDGAAALKEVTFGKPLTSIGANAFDGCTGLTVLDLSKTKNLTNANIGCIFPAAAYVNIKLAGSDLTDLTKINLTGAAASLKKITFAANTTDIPANTFKNFKKLESVKLPTGAALTIGANAFEATPLTSIEIPANVTKIDNEAFLKCATLAETNFVAPEEGYTITMSIGKSAFEGTAVAKVKLTENVRKLSADTYKDCKSLKSFSATGLKSIAASFDGCVNLKSVTIPGTVQTIAANSFKDLANLATVTFGHNSADGDVLTSIGASAFEGCEALTAIDLSATALPDLANTAVFKGCKALATITLPEKLTGNLANDIFAGTAIEKLDASMVDGTVGNIFGTSVKDLGDASDVANTTLKTLKLGDATITIGAFKNCTGLKSATLGGATINSMAFAYCTKLATVTLEPVGQLVDDYAFYYCSDLKNFTYQPSDPSEVSYYFGDQAFIGCTPFVQFHTTQYFVVMYPEAPVNATYGKEIGEDVVKTVQDKANPNQFIAKYANNTGYDVYINAEDAKVYSIYVDGDDAYFQACRTVEGKYWIRDAGMNDNHVIIKTTEAKEVKVTMDPAGAPKYSVGFDDVTDATWETTLGDLQLSMGVSAGEYVYRLTNTEDQGFGFTFFTGTTVKEGQFFVATTKKPEGAGRLNVIWLDEDGNAENEATAIQKIQNTDSENGAIYNLQGVRVEKAQKGLYIQNGKKFIVK